MWNVMFSFLCMKSLLVIFLDLHFYVSDMTNKIGVSLDNVLLIIFLTVGSSQELAMSDTVNKKLCIIGDGATGKTSFLFRFKNNEFDESKEYEPTIFENENKIFDMNGKEINLRKKNNF